MLDDKIGIKMKYPDINTINLTGTGTTADTTGMNIIKDCIDMVFTKEETYERDSFTDEELDEFIDSLSTDHLDKINNFFETMPKLTHTVKVKNPKTKKTREVVIEGFQNFFE
jgi:hypothetical protein